MSGIYVIEGPDGAGKSVLSASLKQVLNLEENKHVGPAPDGIPPLDYYSNFLAKRKGKSGVYDRFALSEVVYDPILRGRDRMVGQMAKLKHIYQSRGVVQIVCLPPPETCYENWSRDVKLCPEKEFYTDSSTFYESYATFAWLTLLHGFITYDYTEESAFNLLKRLGV